jgi:UDP-arabinose 4-epimerase
VLAVAYLSNRGDSAAFNLGTGQGTSVLELIDTVQTVTGRRVPLEHAARRAGDPPTLYAKAELAARVLGWRPRFTSIQEIVETAAASLRTLPESERAAGAAPDLLTIDLRRD